MRQIRTTDEVLTDEALTLCLVAEAEHFGLPGLRLDRLRLQHLCFLVGYKWFEERLKGLNYAFVRSRHGPFTRDLYQTEIDLAAANLIAGEEHWGVRLTPKGRALADQLIEATLSVGDNAAFWDDARSVVTTYGRLTTAELERQVNAMEVTPVGWREAWPLDDIPVGADLTRILEDYEITGALELEPGWLDTFGAVIAGAVPEPAAMLAHAV